MKKALLITSILLTGCSSHTVKTHSGAIKSYGNEIDVAVTGSNQAIVKKLERHIKARLLVRGFDLSEEASATDLVVNVTEYSPGNAAARLIVGFGAGRGSLVYNAKYTNDGTLIVDYDGAERFTGAEFAPGTTYDAGANFGGEETSERILLEEAASHIVDMAN